MGARRSSVTAALVAGAATLLVGCGNAQPGQANAASSAPGVSATTITVGSIADITGIDSSDFATISKGVSAYFDMVNAQGGVDGRKLLLPAADVLDDQGSPTTDTTVAQELVQQRNVFAVVGVATPFFGGASFLAEQATPVFGYPVSADWNSHPTLFGTFGSYLDFTTAAPSLVYLAKQLGATSVGLLAYAVPQSQATCNATAQALPQAGITVGYSDPNLLFGFDPTADVLQFKAHHVNLVVSCLDASGNLSVARALQQDDRGAVTQVWLNGYDRTFIAQNAGLTDGVYFEVQHVPFEAAAQFPDLYGGMASYVAQMNRYEPQFTYDEVAFDGWVDAAQFVQGLRSAGKNLTQGAVVGAINKETGFTADGVMPPVNWGTAHVTGLGVGCDAYVQAVHGSTKAALVKPGGRVFTCFNPPSLVPVPPPAGTPGG